jgi:hypothetical protein
VKRPPRGRGEAHGFGEKFSLDRGALLLLSYPYFESLLDRRAGRKRLGVTRTHPGASGRHELFGDRMKTLAKIIIRLPFQLLMAFGGMMLFGLYIVSEMIMEDAE